MAGAWRSLARRALAPLRPLVAREVETRIRHQTGLVPISQLDPCDVFIAGYPKSGNTWFQNLVAGVIYGIDPAVAPDTLVQELVPDVQYKLYYRRWQTPMFFKTHHLPRPEYRRVVYLLRDGRDAMVSYFHHLSALHGSIDFLDTVRSGRLLFPSRWHEHVEAWLKNPFRAELIVVRYEKLKQDPLGELQNFCRFVGVERTQKELERIIEHASFEHLRSKEVSQGWDNKRWPADKPFIRRGEVGSYRDEMPAPVLDAFLSQARTTLERCGYNAG